MRAGNTGRAQMPRQRGHARVRAPLSPTSPGTWWQSGPAPRRQRVAVRTTSGHRSSQTPRRLRDPATIPHQSQVRQGRRSRQTTEPALGRSHRTRKALPRTPRLGRRPRQSPRPRAPRVRRRARLTSACSAASVPRCQPTTPTAAAGLAERTRPHWPAT